MAVINRFSDHTDITLSCLSKGTVAKKVWGGGEVGEAAVGRGGGTGKGIKISCALPSPAPPEPLLSTPTPSSTGITQQVTGNGSLALYSF